MADLLLLGFIAGFVRGGWSTGFLRRLVGLAYIALSFVVGAYLRQPVGSIMAGDWQRDAPWRKKKAAGK